MIVGSMREKEEREREREREREINGKWRKIEREKGRLKDYTCTDL